VNAWRRLREIGRSLDSEVGILLDKCLEQDFRGIVLAPPVSKTRVGTGELEELLRPFERELAFHVAQVPNTEAEGVEDALDWVAASRMTATPDTLAHEGPETLDGLPFIEIVGLKPIDLALEVRQLGLAADRWRLTNDPALYLVIPRTLVLNPWAGVIAVARPTNESEPNQRD
jgi:hypothetical protein